MTRRFIRPRTLAVAAIPALLLAARWEGKDITFEMRTKMEFTTLEGAEQSRTTVTRVMASGNNVRSERVPQDDDPQEMSSFATLFLNGGRSMLNIDNTARSYFRFDHSEEDFAKMELEHEHNMDFISFSAGPVIAIRSGAEGGAIAMKSAAAGEAVEVAVTVEKERVARAAREKEMAAAAAAGRANVSIVGPGGARAIDVKFEKPKVSDASVSVEHLGEGPTLEGFPTEHYRLTQVATVKTKMNDQEQTTLVETTTDYYYSTDLQAMLAPYKGIQRVLGQMSAMIAPMPMMSRHAAAGGHVMPMMDAAHALMMDREYAKLARTERAKLPKGTPMKTVTESKQTIDGQTRVSVSTAVIESVRKTDLPASTWEVPEGYQNRSMRMQSGVRARGHKE